MVNVFTRLFIYLQKGMSFRNGDMGTFSPRLEIEGIVVSLFEN